MRSGDGPVRSGRNSPLSETPPGRGEAVSEDGSAQLRPPALMAFAPKWRARLCRTAQLCLQERTLDTAPGWVVIPRAAQSLPRVLPSVSTASDFPGCAFSGLGKLATCNSQITTRNAGRRPPNLEVSSSKLRVSSSLPVIVTLPLCPPRRVIGAVHRSGPGSPRPGWMRTGRCPAETAPPEACRGHSTSANRSTDRCPTAQVERVKDHTCDLDIESRSVAQFSPCRPAS